MMPKYFMWDVDGVIVDTEKIHFEAWQYLANQLGGVLTLEKYLEMAGRGSEENLKLICQFLEVPFDPALNKMRRDYYEKLREGGIPVIEENTALIRGIKKQFPDSIHVVVSSAIHKYIDENLHFAGLGDFFYKTFSFEDHHEIKRKPAPDLYLFALKDLGGKAVESAAFEDSSNGVAAAKDAGIRCIALPNPITLGQDLSRADLILQSGERTVEKVSSYLL